MFQSSINASLLLNLFHVKSSMNLKLQNYEVQETRWAFAEGIL
jgi:hypothetical protein